MTTEIKIFNICRKAFKKIKIDLKTIQQKINKYFTHCMKKINKKSINHERIKINGKWKKFYRSGEVE